MPALHELVAGDVQQGITAVLGPTNTGKTHLALERMLRHRTGIIGLPLRLLAREVFDKLVDRVGPASVALVTGEEKIIPPRARYFVCTVEAMPDRPVAFVAVDEIQLAAHRTRGHVFTDRLLHARGLVETLFLGSASMRSLIGQLVPTAEIIGQPRLSRLSHAGHRRLKRLPSRSAVVSFSARGVYEVAELVRRQHGGAAVVLGALSPRTRNAQVALYQSGDVPVLVATDAIGMGLNLDVDHVAFAATRKFDGRTHRDLWDDEVAQIAGRAGRYLRDGTFGTTDGADPFDPLTVEAVEQHRFPPIKRLWWRNHDLDFATPRALLASLEVTPRRRALKRMTDAEDHRALQSMLALPGVASRATSEDRVALLWEVAAVPDYRNSVTSHYAELLGEVFEQLVDHGQLATVWVEEQIARLDRTEGDIGAIMARIAHVRTWTYISHKDSWNQDARASQHRARQIEDRLSDALHERLTARFVDHRIISLPPELAPAKAQVSDAGEISILGTVYGQLNGLVLTANLSRGAIRDEVQAAASAVARRRALDLVGAPHQDFSVDETGLIRWGDHGVGRCRKGSTAASPAVLVLGLPLLASAHRAAIRLRLERWFSEAIRRLTQPLEQGRAGPNKPVQDLVDGLRAGLGLTGPMPLRRLTDLDRRALAKRGVRLGMRSTYLRTVARPNDRPLRGALWRTYYAVEGQLPADDQVLWRHPGGGQGVELLGFVRCGRVSVRVDVLEQVAALCRRAGRRGPFPMPDAVPNVLSAGMDDSALVLQGMGYDRVIVAGHWRFVPPRR